MNTQTTLAHHLQALSQGVEAIMGDYTEDSVVFTQNGSFRGLAAVRGFFDGYLKNAPAGLLEAFTMERQDIDGEVAYIVWKAEPYIKLATDTFVIRNGKIIAQTFVVLS